MAVIDCHLDWCGPCIPMVPNYASLFFNFDDPENRLAFYQYPESAMSEEMKAEMKLDIKPRYIVISNGNIAATIEGNHYVELCAATTNGACGSTKSMSGHGRHTQCATCINVKQT